MKNEKELVSMLVQLGKAVAEAKLDCHLVIMVTIDGDDPDMIQSTCIGYGDAHIMGRMVDKLLEEHPEVLSGMVDEFASNMSPDEIAFAHEMIDSLRLDSPIDKKKMN